MVSEESSEPGARSRRISAAELGAGAKHAANQQLEVGAGVTVPEQNPGRISSLKPLPRVFTRNGRRRRQK